jgi:ATP-dependent DNA helicase RecG
VSHVSGSPEADRVFALVRELCKLPRETEWIEFKENYAEPEGIAEYVSALANSAALVGKTWGYLVWRVQNESHEIVGTTFDHAAATSDRRRSRTGFCDCLRLGLTFDF